LRWSGAEEPKTRTCRVPLYAILIDFRLAPGSAQQEIKRSADGSARFLDDGRTSRAVRCAPARYAAVMHANNMRAQGRQLAVLSCTTMSGLGLRAQPQSRLFFTEKVFSTTKALSDWSLPGLLENSPVLPSRSARPDPQKRGAG